MASILDEESYAEASFEEYEDFESRDLQVVDEATFFGDNVCDNTQTVHELDDCYLTPSEVGLLQAPMTENWKDLHVHMKDCEVKFSIDSCKRESWKTTKKELFHVRDRIRVLTNKDEYEQVSNMDILLLLFGEDSATTRVMMRGLGLDYASFCSFISTLSLQAAYRVTVTELFDRKSALKKEASMSKEEYLSVWKKLADSNKITNKNYYG